MMLRDPVHGLIAFEGEELQLIPRLIDTREVQRLRHIRQLGLTSLAYPGADHTRFSHALGAAHVMTRFLRRLRDIHDTLPFWQRVTTERAQEAVAAALLHDLGHGPLSHLFEDALPDAPAHEEWTRRIVNHPDSEVHQVLKGLDPSLPQRVADLIVGNYPLTFLANAVSGTFDVDRCDYLLRDAHATGVSYGSFDLDWLLRSLRLGIPSRPDQPPPLAIDGAKGLPAIESFTLARLFMFQQVYFHKTSRASEWMLGRILRRVHQLLTKGTYLGECPPALKALTLTGDCSLGDYLALDDTVLWTCVRAWSEHADSVLADLARRLCRRELFKTHELFGDQLALDAQRELLARCQEVAERHGLDPEFYVGLDVASDVPYDERQNALKVIFPAGPSRSPAEVSFLLGRLNGQTVQRVRLLFPEQLRAEILHALSPAAVPS